MKFSLFLISLAAFGQSTKFDPPRQTAVSRGAMSSGAMSKSPLAAAALIAGAMYAQAPPRSGSAAIETPVNALHSPEVNADCTVTLH